MSDVAQSGTDRRLLEEFLLLRDASLKALFAYRGIGMGPGGWNHKDRIAFEELTRVLSRPVPLSPSDAGGKFDPMDRALTACRLLAACRSGEAFLLSPLAWEAVTAEADLALPGYRQYVAVYRAASSELAETHPSPAMGLARLVTEQDILHGFPGDDTLCKVAEDALRASYVEPGPGAPGCASEAQPQDEG